ncbi:MAG: hypothetical protein JXA30_17190 [Deltaproteobacteria bacterium]|nr:hypothetical protein [Deltaproteobacteria bacterium]
MSFYKINKARSWGVLFFIAAFIGIVICAIACGDSDGNTTADANVPQAGADGSVIPQAGSSGSGLVTGGSGGSTQPESGSSGSGLVTGGSGGSVPIEAGVPDGGPATGGSGGSEPVAGSGGSEPVAGSGGSGPVECCTDGDCICREDDPPGLTPENGPYNFETFTYPRGSSHGGATVYYPTDADPPYAGLAMCPGFTATQSSIANWGPFLASHGIVFATLDTTTTGDPVTARDDALLEVIGQLKAENSKSDSPLFGKMSDRYGVSGWSMGGGGTWIAAATDATLKSAMSLAGHNVTAGGASIATGTTVPSMQLCGETDTAILGGGDQSQGVYDVIPDTTPKVLYEFSGTGHMSWGGPMAAGGGTLGSYALAFQKTFLEGDQRWKPFLITEPDNASEWRTNIQ